MAADYRMKKTATEAAPLADGELEFATLETELCIGAPCDERVAETTLLLSFARAGGLCGRVGDWADSLTQTRSKVGRCAASAAHTLVAGRSRRRAAQVQMALVYIEPGLSTPVAEIAELIRRLKVSHGSSLVVVGGDARQRQALVDADGFVADAGSTTIATALRALHLFHLALSAAHRLTCVDREAALQATGSWQEPAVLAEALWQCEPFDVLALSAAATSVLRSAGVETVLLVPNTRRLTLSDLRRLTEWVLQVTGNPGLDVIPAAPVDCASAACTPPGFGTLRMLVRRRTDA